MNAQAHRPSTPSPKPAPLSRHRAWLRRAALVGAVASLGACAVVPGPEGPVVVPARPAIVVAPPVVVAPGVVTVGPRWGYWHRGYVPHRHY